MNLPSDPRPVFHAVAVTAGCALLIHAAWCDLVRRSIPNSLPALLFSVGLAIRIGAGDWRAGGWAAAAIFGAGFGLWSLRLIGGGDVKLLAAAAIFVAPAQIFRLLVLMSLVGGALAVAYLILRAVPLAAERPRRRLSRLVAIEHRRIVRRGPLPYAVAIAGAALAIVIH